MQRRCGDLHKAEASYRRALELRPDFLQAYVGLAGLLVEQGRLAEAETSYRTYASLAPRNADAHYQLGLVLNRLVSLRTLFVRSR